MCKVALAISLVNLLDGSLTEIIRHLNNENVNVLIKIEILYCVIKQFLIIKWLSF